MPIMTQIEASFCGSVIINGRNSRADGTCPTSPTKVTALVLFGAAVIGLIVWAILKSQGIC